MTDITVTSTESQPQPDWGPAMRVLPERWRRAVVALFQTRGVMSDALRIAGYKADNPNSLKSHAWKIFHDDRVRAAVREVAARMIETCEPEVLAVTLDIMRDSGSEPKDRLRAASMIWDRANPVLTKHKIEVEHHVTSDQLDCEHYRALCSIGAPRSAFLDRFGNNGLPRVEALIALEDAKTKTIESDYREVETDGEE